MIALKIMVRTMVTTTMEALHTTAAAKMKIEIVNANSSVLHITALIAPEMPSKNISSTI